MKPRKKDFPPLQNSSSYLLSADKHAGGVTLPVGHQRCVGTEEVTNAQWEMDSMPQSYGAAILVVNPGVFQTAPRSPVSKAEPGDGLPWGTQVPRSVTVDHAPEVAVLSSGQAPTPMPLLSPQYKYASLTKHLDPWGGFSWEARRSYRFALVPRSYLGLEPSWGSGDDRKVWSDSIVVSRVTQGWGERAGSQFLQPEDTHAFGWFVYKATTGPGLAGHAWP